MPNVATVAHPRDALCLLGHGGHLAGGGNHVGAGEIALHFGRVGRIWHHLVDFGLEFFDLSSVLRFELGEFGGGVGKRRTATGEVEVATGTASRTETKLLRFGLVLLLLRLRCLLWFWCFSWRVAASAFELGKFVEEFLSGGIDFESCVEGLGRCCLLQFLLSQLLLEELDLVFEGLHFLGQLESTLVARVGFCLLHGVESHGVERMVALAAERAEVEGATLGASDAAARVATFGAECLAGSHFAAAEGAVGSGRTTADGADGHAGFDFSATRHAAIAALWRATFFAEASAGSERSTALATVRAVVGSGLVLVLMLMNILVFFEILFHSA